MRELSPDLKRLVECKTWADMMQFAGESKKRIGMYPLMLACVIHQADGGEMVLRDETLRAILAQIKASNFSDNFHVRTFPGGMQIKEKDDACEC